MVSEHECQRALTQKQTLCGGGGVLELGDLGLLEDGRELGGALCSDRVDCETAREGWARTVRHQECQRALTQKRTLGGGSALELLNLRLFEDGGERGGALVSDLVATEPVNERRGEDGERAAVRERSSHPPTRERRAAVSAGADTKASTIV